MHRREGISIMRVTHPGKEVNLMDPGYGRQLILLIPGISLSAAAAKDLRSGKIPNGLVLLLMATGVLYCVTDSDGHPARLLMPVLTTALFIPAWLIHGLGAGDIKLLAALSLWTDPESYGRCLVVSFFTAAGISLIVLIVHVFHSLSDRLSGHFLIDFSNRLLNRLVNHLPDSFRNCFSNSFTEAFRNPVPEYGSEFCSCFFPRSLSGRTKKKLRIHFALPVFIGFLLHFGGFY